MATLENWLNRRKGKNTGDLFKLDTKNKTPEQNIVEIIQGLYVKKHAQNESSPTSKSVPTETRPGFRSNYKNGPDSRRMSYLNALVTLLCKEDRNNLGFTSDELMSCLRISLVDDSMLIRATALRVLRYLIKTENDVATFNTLKLPYLVMRSMDLMLRNEEERAQALRVVRRVVGVAGAAGLADAGLTRRRAAVDRGLLRCLVSVARAGTNADGTGDRMARPAIATLAEICVVSPSLVARCGGVCAVRRAAAECATPRMAEALCGALLHAAADPAARSATPLPTPPALDLTYLSAPYCDFHVSASSTDSTHEDREMRFTCSRLALVCVLRSWPGLLHYCRPRGRAGLPALVAALHLPRLEVRKAILDLLYELVGLPQPEWTDEISVALDAVDPSDFQDSWRLNEGFVAAEGTAILPHLASTGPDIVEIHLALLLQCFLEAGLLDGLAEVIVTSDTFISVRATVLLGQLLHLIHLYLPPQLCSVSPALPSLMSQAAAGRPSALAALAALRRHHAMLEARPATHSLFLDHIVQYCSGAFRERGEDNTKSRKEKDNASMAKPRDVRDGSIEFLDESDDEGEPKQRHSVGSRADVATRDTPLRNTAALVKSKSVSSRTSAAVNKVTKTKFFSLFERDSDNLMRCTLVMQNKDGNTWNWEIIRTILKENETTPLLKLSEGGHRAWAARIVSYLKPSANKFSHAELAAVARGQAAARAGCQLVRHLLRHNDADSQRLLEELFYDVSRQIEAIETGLKAHECLFSPLHMCNTMCQMYFLFIGQLCHTQAGLRLFKQTRIYENLLDLSTKTHHSCYVKLVISSLDYTLDSHPREILAKTLTCNIQASRLYATQFLNVLLRASRRSREIVRRKSKLKKNLEHLKAQKDDCDANGVDMETWILQMLVGQIKDESKEVGKCALSILEEAYSVPAFVEKLIPLRSSLARNCHLERSADPRPQPNTAGDRAYLLWLMLEVAAITAASAPAVEDIAFLNRQLEFWTKSYNYRYARLVEASVHAAMSLGAMRALALRRRARPPPHLHAALAAGGPAAAHLRHMLAAVLPEHCRTLQRKKCTSEQDIMDIKASLWAVGHTAAAAGGLQLLLSCTGGASGAGSTSGVSASGASDTAPALVVRLARHSPVCSVRATAFYVLSLIGSTYDGANLLADLGWLCVRHTRHEQFPVIPEELMNGEPGVTSPDRRFDADASEHSDHTDHSAADSLHSDYARPGPTKAGSVDERDLDVVDRPEKHGRKSHTLPSQGWAHERPLPESRTADALQWPPRDPRPLVEGRVRNTSESSTSGVSSCDSFLGRYAIPDRILTLSPIPSSSSLYGMKSSSSSQRPKITDLQRRTSTSSFTAPDVASSPPSNMDMTGYATLKSLNKHRRPHLSESAATSSELDELSWLLADTNRRSARPFSSLRDRAKTTREKMTKLSLLDYDWKPLSLSEGRATTPLRAPARRAQAAPARTNYQGICLPRDLMDVFSWDEEEKEDTDACKANSRLKPLIPSDSSVASVKTKPPPAIDRAKYPSFRPDDVVPSAAFFYASCVNSGAVGSSSLVARRALAAAATHRETLNYANPYTNHNVVSSAVPIPKSIAKLLEMNNKASPSNTGRESATATDSGTRDTVDGLSRSGEVTRMSKSNLSGTEEREEPRPPLDKPQLASGAPSEAGTASSRAGVAGASAAGASGAAGVAGVAGPTLRYPHSPADCLACAPTRPPSAHELREAFFAVPDVGGGGLPEEPERGPRFEILRHAHLMANPIHLRQTRSALLSLKQRHPELFRSACIYSDVCALLARDTYMLCARRFLQELFLDTSFECFATEPVAMLARRGVAAITQ